MGNVIQGTAVVPGRASGTALVADEPLSFWGGYDQLTGEIIDRRHPLAGSNARQRILVIPGTRGSSTTTAVLLEAMRLKTAPAAILTRGPDTFVALAAVVAEELFDQVLPVVALERDDFATLTTGQELRITPEGSVHVFQ